MQDTAFLAITLKRVPLSKQRQVAIFRRDRWLCWSCKKPVIFAPAMRLLEREILKSGFTGSLAYYDTIRAKKSGR